jgi:hypothetical protein
MIPVINMTIASPDLYVWVTDHSIDPATNLLADGLGREQYLLRMVH